jgi:hypothetical protein
MREINGANIDSCLNNILITYYALDSGIEIFEHYRNDVISEDEILNNPDFIKAKEHIRQSMILLKNLYVRNREEDMINRVLLRKN